MNNPFETPYYVYYHIHPGTKDEVVYIGKGSGHRAWTMDSPLRGAAHAEYLRGLTRLGYTPADWVKIIDQNRSEEEAYALEAYLIKELKPRFNKIPGTALVKFTAKMIEEAERLRQEGLSYSDVAELLNVSTMTAYRAINEKTPAREAAFERTK